MPYRPGYVWDGTAWLAVGDPRVAPLAARMDALEVRAPLGHATSHALGGSDALSAAAIGAATDLTPTAVQTGTSVQALAGQLVLVAPTAFQTVTAPTAVPGARFGVKRVNGYNPSANTQVAAGAGQSWVNTDSPPYVRTRDEVQRYRCDTANQWLLEDAGMSSSGANGYFVLGTDLAAVVAQQTFAYVTDLKTGPYTASPGEFVRVNAAGGPVTITLPPRSSGGPVAVKRTDNVTANVVTIAAAAGDTIGEQAATTTTLSTQYQVAELRPGYAATNWAVAGGQLALPSLDARYQAPPRSTATVGATVTIDGTLPGNVPLICTADTVITVTGVPTRDRTLLIECQASGAARTPSVAASVVLVGVASRALAITAAGKVALFGLRYSALRGAWELIAASAEP